MSTAGTHSTSGSSEDNDPGISTATTRRPVMVVPGRVRRHPPSSLDSSHSNNDSAPSLPVDEAAGAVPSVKMTTTNSSSSSHDPPPAAAELTSEEEEEEEVPTPLMSKNNNNKMQALEIDMDESQENDIHPKQINISNTLSLDEDDEECLDDDLEQLLATKKKKKKKTSSKAASSRFCFCCPEPERIGNLRIVLPQRFERTGFGVVGPHWFGPPVVLGILLLASTHFVSQSWHTIGPITTAICLLFQFTTTYLLIHTAYRDPGVVRAKIDRETAVAKRYCWCDTCQNFQPTNAQHCPDCNVCVAGFDHHCVWMGTCIGRRNLQAFVRFNLSWLLYLLYAIVWVSIVGPQLSERQV